MNDLKQQLRQRLIANIIIDKCAHCGNIVFRDAWCTQDRILRFTTPFFRRLFSVAESQKGKWKTGDYVMYEIHNTGSALTVDCVMSVSSMNYAVMAARDSLLRAAGVHTAQPSPNITLKTWSLSSADGDPNRLPDIFDRLLEIEVPAFEQELQAEMDAAKPEMTELREGKPKTLVLNKYERNQKARAACLAANGTACAVCGIDFGKVYGPEFAGKIEVHHIVPLSSIGEEYIVDPVHDLAPVCPNCHTALHSKKEGVYTVEELKTILATP